jgi:RNA polymerase sigma factor (sigma-70 family)
MNISDEKKLIKKILSGRKDFFSELVANYKNLVIHIVYGMVQNQCDRDDLCQEIFLKIYVNLSSFNFKSKLSTWIGRIAYNSCLNHFARKKLPVTEAVSPGEAGSEFHPLDKIPADAQQPDESLISEEITQRLKQEVLNLPTKYRVAISLYHFDELNYKEISEIMNLSIDNLKVRLYRGRAILRKNLLEHFTKEELKS